MDWADWLFRFLPVREKDKYQFVGDFSHSEERRIRRKLHRPSLEIEETVRRENGAAPGPSIVALPGRGYPPPRAGGWPDRVRRRLGRRSSGRGT